MKFTAKAAALLVLFGSPVRAQSASPATPSAPPETKTAATAPADAAATVQERIEDAIAAYQAEADALIAKAQAQKGGSGKREMFKKRPDSSKAADLILKLAKENPKAEGVENGLAWCLKNARISQVEEAAPLLLENYSGSKSIRLLISRYARLWNGGEDGLRQVIEKASDERTRQSATYCLASKLLKKKGSKAEGVATMEKLLKWPGIAKSNPRLLAQAKSTLFVAKNLSVGSRAPDIAGTDHEGKEFKLSDYRGKVVLLDFWGFW